MNFNQPPEEDALEEDFETPILEEAEDLDPEVLDAFIDIEGVFRSIAARFPAWKQAAESFIKLG